jgi:hypothetical protein
LAANNLQLKPIVRTSSRSNYIDAHTSGILGVKALSLIEVVVGKDAALLHLNAVIVFTEVGCVS